MAEVPSKSEILAEYLMEYAVGESQAKTARDLRAFGKPVEIRQYVHTLRVSGHPICSNQNGYFYASQVSDVEMTMANLRSRVKSIQQAYDGLESSKWQMLKRQRDVYEAYDDD